MPNPFWFQRSQLFFVGMCPIGHKAAFAYVFQICHATDTNRKLSGCVCTISDILGNKNISETWVTLLDKAYIYSFNKFFFENINLENKKLLEHKTVLHRAPESDHH